VNREDEAKRDLARLEAEREKLFGTQAGQDDDDNDPVVRLGKRIARILGPLLAAGILLHLALTYWPRS
jgi:hypothetical protein